MSDDAQIKKWQDEIARLQELIREQHKEARQMRIWLILAAIAGPLGFLYRPWLGPVLVGFLVTIFFVGVYLTRVHISERSFLLERAREECARLGGRERSTPPAAGRDDAGSSAPAEPT